MTTITPIIPPIRTPVDKSGPELLFEFAVASPVPKGVGVAVGSAAGIDVTVITKLLGTLVCDCCTNGVRVGSVMGARGLSVEDGLMVEGLFEGVVVGKVEGNNEGSNEGVMEGCTLGDEVERVGVLDGIVDGANVGFGIGEFVGIVVGMKQVLHKEPSGQYWHCEQPTVVFLYKGQIPGGLELTVAWRSDEA